MTEGILVRNQVNAEFAATRIKFADFFAGQCAPALPDGFVLAVGERVLGVKLQLVDFEISEMLGEIEQCFKFGHAAARNVEHHTATREIRAWETAHHAPRVPIVALTAHALSGAGAESSEAGCDGHITKPVERDDLVAAIAKYAKRPMAASTPMPPTIAARRPAFLANRRQDLVKMRDALAAGDFAAIQSIGHNCKGIGTGYGFPDISNLGSAIEKAAKALDTHELEETINEFESHLQAASGR